MQRPLALPLTFLSALLSPPVRGPPFEVFEKHQKQVVGDGSVLFPPFRGVRDTRVLAVAVDLLRERLDCFDSFFGGHGLWQFQDRLVEGFHEGFLDAWVEVLYGLYSSGAGNVSRLCQYWR